MKLCKRCSLPYDTKMISSKYLIKDPEKYEFCSNCRKYKRCINCESEFHHKQNQTCSTKCRDEAKSKSYMISCGTKHNLCKRSTSRIKWEDRILEKEGISNVFQRDDVKMKTRNTLEKKYGVSHISKLERVKKSKSDKLKSLIQIDPYFFKRKWLEVHNTLVNNLGYDPRLGIIGKASLESLNVFSKILDFCIGIGIEYADIYLGIDNKSEFFIKDGCRIYFYDFTIRKYKIIIEFHGTTFHARNTDDIWMNPFTGERAKENIEKRILKNEIANKHGYKILEIWSDNSVYNNIEYCKKFILENK